MMEAHQLTCAVEPAEGLMRGAAVKELRDFISAEVDGVSLRIANEREDAQDVGTILQIVLQSGAVLALARGIAKWLEYRNRSAVIVKHGSSEFIVRNVTARQAEGIAKDLTRLIEGRGETDPK